MHSGIVEDVFLILDHEVFTLSLKQDNNVFIDFVQKSLLTKATFTISPSIEKHNPCGVTYIFIKDADDRQTQ